jgi:hypothetical protein
MNLKQQRQFNYMLNTLKKIAREYMTPAQIFRDGKKSYGLSWSEILEMSYENIQLDAAAAIKGVREIKLNTEQKPETSVARNDDSSTDADNQNNN